jgi:hypothetical protein
MKGIMSMKRLSAFVLCAAFTLGAAVFAAPGGPAPVDLGSAARFAVLSGTQVTNTATATIINGDLGQWPTADIPTGFVFSVSPGPGVVNGSVHIADLAAENGQAALTIAYNDAAGRTTGVVVLTDNVDLGGQTLVPGLYKYNGSAAVLTGDLILHGKGVYIFQIAAGLTVSNGARVVLTGGAQAADVFWQVGSTATLGTNSEFNGTILAFTSITLATGATMDGRALARNGDVTLDFNTITVPSGKVKGKP